MKKHIVPKQNAGIITGYMDRLKATKDEVLRQEFELENIRRSLFEALWVYLELPYTTQGSISRNDDGDVIFEEVESEDKTTTGE